jgi:hypothetical protein
MRPMGVREIIEFNKFSLERICNIKIKQLEIRKSNTLQKKRDVKDTAYKLDRLSA